MPKAIKRNEFKNWKYIEKKLVKYRKSWTATNQFKRIVQHLREVITTATTLAYYRGWDDALDTQDRLKKRRRK